MRRIIGGLAISMLLVSCFQKKEVRQAEVAETEQDSARIEVKYAEEFDVRYEEGFVLVDIQDPQKKDEKSKVYRFALIPRGTTPTGVPSEYETIETPVKKVICMTSLQLSSFIKLNALDNIVGLTSARHLFNNDIKSRIENGQIAKIGMEGNFDSEVVLNANPDLILISPFKRGGYDNVKETGIPLMPYLGYKELTPLAQAEWIKFVGLLLDKKNIANAAFDKIERKYLEAKRLAENVKKRPVVFSGEMRGGNWYAVGGKSFLAQIFRDAGADYFLKDDTHSGGQNLDFETVYSQADDCEYWRILNSFDGDFNYEALASEDPRYQDFRAFKDRKVVYCNMKKVPYYEDMPMEPDLVLKDFIFAFHPELLPDYEPKFYKILK